MSLWWTSPFVCLALVFYVVLQECSSCSWRFRPSFTVQVSGGEQRGGEEGWSPPSASSAVGFLTTAQPRSARRQCRFLPATVCLWLHLTLQKHWEKRCSVGWFSHFIFLNEKNPLIFWHEFTMLSFILCVTKPCGYSLLLSLGRIHSFMDCHQKFKAYLKS